MSLFNKIFTKGVLTSFIIVLFILGLVAYVEHNEYKFKTLENKIDERDAKIAQMDKELNFSINDLQNLLLSTATNLASVLEQEQQRNNSLKEEFENITDTVDTLEKLSTTDPELLKKYSKVYFLNEHYVPSDLDEVPEEYRSIKSTNFEIHSDVLPFLMEMIDEATYDGLSLKMLSAYRSFTTQSILKATYTMTYGTTTANRFSADQGYSEHQLGTAVDFTTIKLAGALEEFDKTEEYKWLLNNAYKYGFIISYPYGNTYYKFEPWHWRFVGVDLARKLHRDGIYFYDADQRLIDSYLVNIFD